MNEKLFVSDSKNFATGIGRYHAVFLTKRRGNVTCEGYEKRFAYDAKWGDK